MNPVSFNRRELLAGIAAGAAVGQSVHAAQAAELPISTREMWTWVRAQQILDPGTTYLDTGNIGPGLRAALASEYRHLELFNADVEAYRRRYMSAAALTQSLQRLATAFGCSADELTYTQGASEALALVANGLELSPGDEVIIPASAHSSAIYPWLLRAQRGGIVVKQVQIPSPLEQSADAFGLFASLTTEKTRVMVVPHLQHTDGAILPVADICSYARQRNILTVVDGAQAVGSLDVSLADIGCDFYAGSLHKWMNGPYGLGLLYVRRAQLQVLATTDRCGIAAATMNSARNE